MPVLHPRMTFKVIAPQDPTEAVSGSNTASTPTMLTAGWAVTDAGGGSFLSLYFPQLTFNPYKQEEANSSTHQETLFEALVMGWMTPC